jgi:enterochelin esterase family protein
MKTIKLIPLISALFGMTFLMQGQITYDIMLTPTDSPFRSFVARLENLPEAERKLAVEMFIADNPVTPIIEHDSMVHLYFYGTAASVLIHGDYQNGWARPDTLASTSCGGTSFFYITYVVPVNARLDYVLQVGGNTQTDPRNPRITPSGYGPHSEIAMPGLHPDPSRLNRKDIAHGKMDTLLLTSNLPDILPREALVYLPPGYKKLDSLPVLYVLDGLEALVFMNYRYVLDNLIADGKIPPVMAVFIPPADRSGEFMGNRKEAFVSALCDDYVPQVDKAYRTDPRPEKRGITGISAGGYLALYTGLTRPEVFLCSAGQSPSITTDLHLARKSFPKKNKANAALRLYFDVGTYDLPAGTLGPLSFAEAARNLDQQMKKQGIPHVFNEFPDGHEWANWRERTDDILLYFFSE